MDGLEGAYVVKSEPEVANLADLVDDNENTGSASGYHQHYDNVYDQPHVQYSGQHQAGEHYTSYDYSDPVNQVHDGSYWNSTDPSGSSGWYHQDIGHQQYYHEDSSSSATMSSSTTTQQAVEPTAAVFVDCDSGTVTEIQPEASTAAKGGRKRKQQQVKTKKCNNVSPTSMARTPWRRRFKPSDYSHLTTAWDRELASTWDEFKHFSNRQSAFTEQHFIDFLYSLHVNHGLKQSTLINLRQQLSIKYNSEIGGDFTREFPGVMKFIRNQIKASKAGSEEASGSDEQRQAKAKLELDKKHEKLLKKAMNLLEEVCGKTFDEVTHDDLVKFFTFLKEERHYSAGTIRSQYIFVLNKHCLRTDGMEFRMKFPHIGSFIDLNIR